MAEIPIERKESRNWLPLILGLLALLLLLGFCFMRRGNDGVATAPADSAAVAAAPGATDSAAGNTAAAPVAGAAAGAAAAGGDANGAIEQFAQFVQQRDTTQETEGQHAYTAEGTRRLAAALDAVAGGNPNISVYADSMRSSIDRLQRSSDKDVHADDAKAAFSAAVSAMEQIDRARGRTRDVAPMRAIYGQLSSQRPLLPQLGTVHRFFEAARDALNGMRA
jgi:hypothetical protein